MRAYAGNTSLQGFFLEGHRMGNSLEVRVPPPCDNQSAWWRKALGNNPQNTIHTTHWKQNSKKRADTRGGREEAQLHFPYIGLPQGEPPMESMDNSLEKAP